MKGIKDRVMLGVLAGVVGNLAKTAVDELSLIGQISQRPFRTTAAGVWVPSRKEASAIKGQILGTMFDFGLAGLSGVGMVYLLTRTGRDFWFPKGVFYGLSFGSVVNAMLSGLPKNKVRPKDAVSNLSYVVAHALWGVTAAAVAVYAGHPALYDTKPLSDYLQPTVTTTEQKTRRRRSRQRRGQPPQPEQQSPEIARH